MKREEAFKLLKSYINNKNLIKHMLAAEICMRELAAWFSEDQDKWGIAGLLHDIDYEITNNTPEEHGLRSAQILQGAGFDEDIVNAVMAHAGKKVLENKMEMAIYSVDPMTGLIIASVLMHPSRRLNGMEIEFLMKRFKEKRFAAGADRDQISASSSLGLDIETFSAICLKSMQKISNELGF